MGENGAGKSTLFRCLSGLEKYEGEIIIPSNTDIGFLSDTLYFYPLITGNEFIKILPGSWKNKIYPARYRPSKSDFQITVKSFSYKIFFGYEKTTHAYDHDAKR